MSHWLILHNTLLFFIAGLGSLAVGALVLNNPPLYARPGLWRRLWAYLTQNTAETRRNHPFGELELRSYPLVPAALAPRVAHAVAVLGWGVVEEDFPHTLRAVAQTPFLRFKDDVEIHLVVGDQGTELHVRATSRVGLGDFGANTRHIIDLHEALSRQA